MTIPALPRITLVTVTFNAMGVWEDFWASMLAQQAVDWHLVVVDNRSSDGTAAMLATIDDPRVTVVLNDHNAGVAAGNNQGIRIGMERQAASICLINNDVVFGPRLLIDLEMRRQASNADAVSPLIPFFGEPDQIWYGGGSFSPLKGYVNRHDHEGQPLAVVGTQPFRTDYAPTCCMLIATGVFERIGLMDEAYFVYWDDTDFLWRMKLAGMSVVVDPAILLYHKVSASTGGQTSPFSIRYAHRNQIYFVRKHHGPLALGYTICALTAFLAARVLVKGDKPGTTRLYINAIIEGLRMPHPRSTRA